MGASVKVNQSFKYLDLVVDNKWNFKEHFRVLLPKAKKMTAALSRLMPNVRGPSKRRRRLYAEVIHSLIIYGSPVWASVMTRNRKTSGDVQRVQRRLALRVISAYRTVSHEAAGILVRIIPGDILANRHRRMYERSCAAREDVSFLTNRARAALRREERARDIAEWKSRLEDCEDDQPGSRIREALVSKLEDWMNRNGGLMFHITQILTGHGCFNHYLYKIGRLTSPACSHCEGGG